MNYQKIYKTKNFYLSCYLIANGEELAGIDKSNPQRAEFAFLGSPEMEQLVESFNFGNKCFVEVHKYNFAIKTLKSKLYD